MVTDTARYHHLLTGRRTEFPINSWPRRTLRCVALRALPAIRSITKSVVILTYSLHAVNRRQRKYRCSQRRWGISPWRPPIYHRAASPT